MSVLQSLEWQVSQRSQEVQAAREQLALCEQRQASEIEGLRRALQVGSGIVVLAGQVDTSQ